MSVVPGKGKLETVSSKHDVIYLDNNASTPCDPRVVEAMLPFFGDVFANPSSRNHGPGREAFTALEEARATVARCLGAHSPTEIFFTSGASEGNNLALIGAATALSGRGRHLVTQATEHPSVLEPLRHLAASGWDLSVVGVDGDGRVRLDEIEKALRDDTALVSLMLANNETGTLQPVRAAADLAHVRSGLIHCDAAQGAGKIEFDVDSLGADLLTVSGHKVYGPKGIGALYVRRRRPPLRLPPIIRGGGHESGLRSGTPNVPGAVALAHALEIARDGLAGEAARIAALRDRLEARIVEAVEGCTVNGSRAHRLPGTSNLSFAGIEGNALLASLPDIAVSTGSACASNHPEASPVLRAMGVDKGLASASVRVSLGRFTTGDEVERAAQRIIEEVTRLRSLSRRRRR
jgi:cysteine desulfurase